MMGNHGLYPAQEPFSRTVVTVGNFDGVHLGHRAILSRVLKRAQEYPAPSEDLDKKMQDLWTEMIQAQ